MTRYFVDDRSGCIAVRDRTLTDPDYPGLHEDTTGVVRYWHGNLAPKIVCPICHHARSNGWVISDTVKLAAQKLCDSLNGSEPTNEVNK